jgi:hypothetical protein
MSGCRRQLEGHLASGVRGTSGQVLRQGILLLLATVLEHVLVPVRWLSQPALRPVQLVEDKECLSS